MSSVETANSTMVSSCKSMSVQVHCPPKFYLQHEQEWFLIPSCIVWKKFNRGHNFLFFLRGENLEPPWMFVITDSWVGGGRPRWFCTLGHSFPIIQHVDWHSFKRQYHDRQGLCVCTDSRPSGPILEKKFQGLFLVPVHPRLHQL